MTGMSLCRSSCKQIQRGKYIHKLLYLSPPCCKAASRLRQYHFILTNKNLDFTITPIQHIPRDTHFLVSKHVSKKGKSKSDSLFVQDVSAIASKAPPALCRRVRYRTCLWRFSIDSN